MKNWNIVEVPAPNMLEDMFPHSMPPHVVFDSPVTETVCGKTYTLNPADMKTRDIHITDTTFRDGQQSRPPYSVEEILTLFDLIHKLGGPQGVIRQTEFFLYSANDRKVVEKCLEKNYKFPEITGWIRAEVEDLHLPAKLGLKETGMLTSCSDYHIFHKLRLDRKRAFRKIYHPRKRSHCTGRPSPLPPRRYHPCRHRRFCHSLRPGTDANFRRR